MYIDITFENIYNIDMHTSTKQQRYFDIITTFASGIMTFIIGIILLKADAKDYYLFIYLSAAILIVNSFHHVIKAIRNLEVRKNNLFRSLIELICGLIIATAPNFPLKMLSLVFTFYLLLTSFIYMINFFLLKGTYNRNKSLLLSLFSLIIGIIFFSAFEMDLYISIYFVSGYFLIWGISMMVNALIDLFFKKTNNPKIRMCLPAIIDCFIPNMWLNRVNKYYSERVDEDFKPTKSNQESDLEVFIHASHNGFNTFGHVDLMFDGILYSYGNYDGSSERFFSTIGDGVVFKTKDRDAYIKFCLKRCKKTLFVFGLKLSDMEKNRIRDQIEKLNQDMIQWDPKFIHQPLDKDAPSINLHVHQIYNEAHGDLFKFKKGYFKKYYVFGTNCVRFADEIIGKNIDILKMVGFITPGTYLDYFDGEFNRTSSNVVSREIYSIYNYDIGEDDENDPYKDFD